MNSFLITVIAEGPPKNNGPDFGKASPIGLVVVVLLIVATFFLVRSMNKQLKKVPESFDRQHPEPDQAADDGTDALDGIDREIPGGNGSTRPPGSTHESG
ncbi:hypothetical protein [Mycobacterium asiaticum]|uniref:Uncharacterized protein n=1 Tax=Mycobacterium asiaticum TaxID=1790 RepID=A0A1A3KUS2_MYCAS|nr:hypothetical protein [Mycobacterium asiaticum]OBI93218.1 hypothetical protein A5661_24195 [Mycobacterium asiaticum]OBJ62936.1 hypothetical protein A9W94_11385 [Mycobacterium asiaticum]OBJ88952.1 hypothetical protein A5640_03795 [Mycobacterium asiaticum]ORA11324.1 hypothetical protein BST16_19670 [Mycobacterium asiaticum DSM 44297]